MRSTFNAKIICPTGGLFCISGAAVIVCALAEEDHFSHRVSGGFLLQRIKLLERWEERWREVRDGRRAIKGFRPGGSAMRKSLPGHDPPIGVQLCIQRGWVAAQDHHAAKGMQNAGKFLMLL